MAWGLGLGGNAGFRMATGTISYRAEQLDSVGSVLLVVSPRFVLGLP